MAKKRMTTKKPASNKKIHKSMSFDQVVISVVVATTLLIVGFLSINAWNNRIVKIEGVERTYETVQGHQETVVYDTPGLPPTGGMHSATWQNCGVYNQPLADENVVHSLEHGAVWITYQPDLPPEQVELLRRIARGSTKRILSPYPGQTSAIVVTAWGYRLTVANVDDPRIEQFVRNYEDAGDSPEPGALCSGGVGQPLP